MVMMHKIKAKKTISGRFGRKKIVEVDVYAPSTRTHISEMAGHAAGVSDGEAVYATHTHLHFGEGGKRYVFLGKKKGYDEFAYDALIGVLGGIASWKYGVERLDEKYLQILIDRGERVGEVYKELTPVKEIKKLTLLSQTAIKRLPCSYQASTNL